MNPLPKAKGGTTEKTVSIIEQIINSIAANLTSPPPFTSNQGSTSTTTTTESSKSAILKLATKKTKTDNDTDTTDKPTTIIEQILNSLSAIQATDDTNSDQVGKDFNTISSSSTTPLPTKPFSSLDSHHQSTSINPLSVLDEITPEEALEKRTIGTLLDILNGIKSHKKDDVVLVTPKRPYVNTQSTTAVIPISAFLSRPQGTTTSTSTTTSTLSTNTPEAVSETITPSSATTETLVTESSTNIETTTLPISTATPAETTTPATTITTQSTTLTTVPTNPSTTVRPLFHPHIFEVSPASVKIISANDFYTVPPDDNSLTTVTIASRTTYDNLGTTISSTTTTEEDGTTTTILPEVTTLMEVGTTLETTTVQDSTTIMPPNTTDAPPPSNRSGKLLNSIQDPVSNSIDVSSSTTSTTPDYFIFAVLNNNTILRKRPPTIPNKDTPFVIVGVYPNNTIIRKFPNGTEVPMDPIVRVSGFDTRDPPPPLPEITSNQVTGPTEDSRAPMGDQTTASIDTNNLPLESDAGWYTAFQEASNLERGSTIDTSKAVDHVYRIPPRKSKSYSSETSGTIGNNDVGTIPANIFSSILQGVGTTSTERSRFPEFSFDLGSGTTTTSSVVQIPGSTSKTLGGFWGVNVGVDGTTSSTTTAAASTTTTANYRIIPFNKYNQILNIQDLIRGNDEEISREQVVTVEMTTRPSEISTSTTTTKAPTSTTTAVPKVPPTKPVLPQTPFVEEIITVPSISVDAPTTTAVPTTMPTLTTEAATTIAPTTEAPTTAKSTTTTTTTTSTTSTSTTTTPKPTTTKIQTVRFISTTQRYTSTPTRVPRPTTTEAPSYVPSFLTTLFPILLTPEPTKAPKYTTTKSNGPEVLSFAASTAQPATVAAIPPRKRTTARTTPAPQKKRRTTTTTTTTTTTPSTTTTRKTTTTEKVVEVQSSTKRSVDLTDLNTISVTAKSTKKKLTPEQKRNLETLMQLEKEQAALLQQLSFLTTLNFGGNNGKGAASALSNTNLASRIAQLTSERSKPTTSSTKSPATSKKTTKQPHSIQDQLAALGVTTPKPSRNTPSLEDVLKQYDLDGVELTTKAPAAKYGTSSDAILASILKEQGIAPPTPKSLAAQIEQAGVFDETTTKRPRPRPRPTAAPPRPRGGLLNWLLNAFAPPPSAPPPRRTKPKPKPKPTKPKKPPVEQELLANSPTHVTPIVTTAPKSPSPNSLSQDDIQKLIKQLEGLQKDPKGQVDLSQVKSLQTLINTDGPGVEVRTNGEHGATSHKPSTTRRPRARKTTTTAEPLLTVAEEDEDDEEFSNAVSTPRSHVRGHTVAPLGFNPVPGVDEDGPGRMIRSNLLTAAVNVTRAMAGFLGTAIQVKKCIKSCLIDPFVGSSKKLEIQSSSLEEEYCSKVVFAS
nr:unnamed protein product [Callosobruchus chinensis]